VFTAGLPVSRSKKKGADYHWIEINPFAPDVPQSYLALHPFKRVPALVHDTFQVYETGAITRYVDEAFPGPSLQPTDPHHRARANQFLSIIDSYVYWPLVVDDVGEDRVSRHHAAVACVTGITVKRVREERQQADRTRRRFQQ